MTKLRYESHKDLMLHLLFLPEYYLRIAWNI
jgi:hypothetical protein